jgi:heme o synthase
MKKLSTVKKYYQLTKPGVLYGNVLTVAAGFLLASRGDVNFGLFAAVLAGSTLIIASACVINNYLDRDIDSLMERTKKRPIVAGSVDGKNAVIFGSVLGVLGLGTLSLYTNWLVVAVGLVGFIVYVFFYGALSKRRSMHGTLVGSVSGAIPILAGYVGASGRIDLGAVIVFLILFFWQMPEFYSIAIYRRKEYKKANVPVITVIKDVGYTKRHIFGYTLAFAISAVSLAVLGYAGTTYLVVMGLLSMYWLSLSYKGFSIKDSDDWARQMFRFSLIVLLVFCGLLSINNFIP